MRAHIVLGFLTHADHSETVTLYAGGDGQKAQDAYAAARDEKPPRFARIGLARNVRWSKRMDLQAKRKRGFNLHLVEDEAPAPAPEPVAEITPLPQPLAPPAPSDASTPAKPAKPARSIKQPAPDLTLSALTGDGTDE